MSKHRCLTKPCTEVREAGVPRLRLHCECSVIAGVIFIKPTLIGLDMKPSYSLRLFAIGTIVLGTIAALVMQHWSRVDPVQLNAVFLGKLSDDPAEPVEEPTLDEVMHAIDRESRSLGSDFLGRITELKILTVTTSIGPRRLVPLIGNACLHRAMFQCSVKLVHSDGSVSRKVVLIEKNAFRLIKDES